MPLRMKSAEAHTYADKNIAAINHSCTKRLKRMLEKEKIGKKKPSATLGSLQISNCFRRYIPRLFRPRSRVRTRGDFGLFG